MSWEEFSVQIQTIFVEVSSDVSSLIFSNDMFSDGSELSTDYLRVHSFVTEECRRRFYMWSYFVISSDTKLIWLERWSCISDIRTSVRNTHYVYLTFPYSTLKSRETDKSFRFWWYFEVCLCRIVSRRHVSVTDVSMMRVSAWDIHLSHTSNINFLRTKHSWSKNSLRFPVFGNQRQTLIVTYFNIDWNYIFLNLSYS